MSDFAAKNYSGLMEAYASIYQQPNQVIEEQVDQEIYFEDLEVDTDIMVDLLVERLIVEGYANTEDQALNMIPHMSDAWLDTVVGNFVLEESFIDVVNSVVEEGYDLSSYTVDELYEEYVGHFNNYLNEDHSMDLHEAIPLLAAPLLANPATWAAGAGLAAGIGYAGKKALDAYRQMRSGTSAEGERWLQQGVLQARTRKQSQDQRRLQQGKERVLQRQQQKAAQQPAAPAQPAKPPTLTREKVAPKGSSGTSTGGTPQGQPGGGDKKPEWMKNFTDALFKKGQKKPPSPMMQQAKQKAAEVAGTAARKIAKGALGLGIGGAVDQGLLGGFGGKVTRDLTRLSRGAGPGYEQLKRELKGLKGEPAPAPKPPAVDTEAEKKRIQNLFK